MVVVERRQLEVVEVENRQQGMVITEDGPLEQVLSPERIFQRTCHQYSWQVQMVWVEDRLEEAEDGHLMGAADGHLMGAEDGHLLGAEYGQLVVGDRYLEQSMHLE